MICGGWNGKRGMDMCEVLFVFVLLQCSCHQTLMYFLLFFVCLFASFHSFGCVVYLLRMECEM